ncbi:hypothetical protein ACVMFA_006213 [Bradyrhizobium liaoningense]
MITQGRRMAPGKQQAVNLEESVPGSVREVLQKLSG